MPREKIPTATGTRRSASRKPIAIEKAIESAVQSASGHSPTFATTFMDPDLRTALIAEAAFFRAERRGFEPGHEMEDWLQAEAEVDARLMHGESALRV
jgi:hypothetical protein